MKRFLMAAAVIVGLTAVGGDGSAGRRSKLQAAAPAKADLISRLGEEGNLLTLASAEFINGDHSPTAE